MIKGIFRKIVIFLITLEARLVLKKYKPRIVAITGNAGKTGTKDAVAAVLESEFFVWKNEKSYNSDLGIPLTILHCKNAWMNPIAWLKNIAEGLVLIFLPHKYPEWLVVEVGADKPDDIGKFTSWLHPEIVVVTRIGETPVHVENFSSRDELIKEKSKLVSALRPGGTLILNSDDPDVLNMRNIPKLAKVITYGFSPGSNLRASNYNIIYSESNHTSLPDGMTFKIDYLGNIVPVRITGIVGKNNIYSALAAFAAGLAFNINFVSMLDSIAKYERPVGRLKLIKGINDSAILDDTYNSSPAALDLAIESVKDIQTTGRKIAVLGDMLELGQYTTEAHNMIGKKIPDIFEILVTVGQRTQDIVRGAVASRMGKRKIKSFDDSRSAGEYLKKIIEKGDIILVKGSQGMRMERVVEQIMLNPEDKFKLIPRQEKEWVDKV
jgi:UDP-N-acetylmuramoyl-tripeptide--D-alanyl-D-alanine ligase